ncbi:SEC-C domain-containing protein [Streptomyces sp. RS10V-4]|uniref:YchJ family protein n=1 Tax=Streptomyces rhizoryzae TaxID=2932493 RepID=UPI0020059CCA|nr:YchJ family metal-binding protein [Streptomyces rhizoryzae]MCK7621585.1 SEC-C domain-containing protein [Streptomyces rhizoryzae]
MSHSRKPPRTTGRRTRPQSTARPAVTENSPCPCGREARYGECCAPFHQGRAAAPGPERLMRSRYSAFAVGDTAYLLRSWHSTTRPPALDLDPALRWTGLTILSTTGGSAFHDEGTVAFRADYTAHGRPGSQEEHSRFVREDGRWVYLDALPEDTP